jgi:Skp family chaperone for outer membrane proteins
MESLKRMSGLAVLGIVLAAAPAFAQAAGAQQPPATPPAAQQPEAPPPAPAPFPEGATVAFVDVQFIATNSESGRVARERLEALNTKLMGEIQDKFKALEANRTKLQQGGSVMSPQAISQLQKEIEKQERDLQFAQQDAQREMGELEQDLLEEFQNQLNPIVEAIRQEKGLLMIFSALDAGLAAAHPGLNLSAEVVKRLDAAKPAPADKK